MAQLLFDILFVAVVALIYLGLRAVRRLIRKLLHPHSSTVQIERTAETKPARSTEAPKDTQHHKQSQVTDSLSPRRLSELHILTQTPQTMYLTAARCPVKMNYKLMMTSTVKVEWVSRYDPSHQRVPSEVTHKFAKDRPLVILGEQYPSLFDPQSPFIGLTHGQHVYDWLARDIVCFRERFPCFDSADYANENRYFYWFFIREGDVLARVFYEDETDEVIVTEDVAYIETSCWNDMQAAGFCQPGHESDR